jgi:hypothetical protein
MRPAPTRRADPLGLVLSLIFAPLVAALIGAAAFLTAIPALPAEGAEVLGEALVIGTLVVSVIVCYLLGGPLILAVWLLAHLTGRRGVLAMGLFEAGAGLMFSAQIFGPLRSVRFGVADETGVVPPMLAAGALAGFTVGLIIAKLGYRDAPAAADPED